MSSWQCCQTAALSCLHEDPLGPLPPALLFRERWKVDKSSSPPGTRPVASPRVVSPGIEAVVSSASGEPVLLVAIIGAVTRLR